MSDCALEFEDQRLAALYDYDVLDSRPEESFDRITRLVKLTVGTSMAVVSLVDQNRQWYKSRQGTEVIETPRATSFCTHTIQRNEPLIIPDATQDPRFRASPLVTCENGVRMYVGVPLRTPSGFNIGALCAMDTKPRDVSPEQISVMQDLARLVVDELELRKLAAIDSLTGAMTARSFALESKKAVARARRNAEQVGCIMMDLDHFKTVNDTFGHAAGDQVLANIAAACLEELRDYDLFARVGGEEFAIVLPQTSLSDALGMAERLRKRIEDMSLTYLAREVRVTASFGVTVLSDNDMDIGEAMKRADAAVYSAKEQGRNCIRVSAPKIGAVITSDAA